MLAQGLANWMIDGALLVLSGAILLALVVSVCLPLIL